MSFTLVFKAYTYNFLLLMGLVNLLMFNIARPGDRVDLGALRATGMKHNETH